MENTLSKMPVLFLGHGSPMNAVEENEFVEGFRSVGKELPKPRAILCISAHWETKGTLVTAMENPRTIHDFRGFPQELYAIEYPAKGNSALAQQIKSIIKSAGVGLDYDWGLDHGAWSVIKHLYPIADIPVVQLSLDYYREPQYHYNLAKELISLRREGVLIIGSGNIIHNLGLVVWNRMSEIFAFDWAAEASDKIKKLIMNDEHLPLINYKELGSEVRLAIPTPEHYLPLLYTLALKENGESIKFFNDKPVGGSLTMTSLIIS